MKFFSVYLCGVSLSLGIFNGFAVLFGARQLVEFATVVAAGGNPFDAAAGISGLFLNALLSVAYFVMGLVFLRRESAGTLNVNEALVGWLGLLALFGANFFGVQLIASMLAAIGSPLVP